MKILKNRKIIVLVLCAVFISSAALFHKKIINVVENTFYRNELSIKYSGGRECSNFEKVNILIVSSPEFSIDKKYSFLRAMSLQKIFEENLDYFFRDIPIENFSSNPSLYKFFLKDNPPTIFTTDLGNDYKDDASSLTVLFLVRKSEYEGNPILILSIGKYRKNDSPYAPVMAINNMSKIKIIPLIEDSKKIILEIGNYIHENGCGHIFIDQ